MKKTDNSPKKDIENLAREVYERLPWEAVAGGKSGKLPSAKAVSFLLEEDNYKFAVESVLKSLKKTDSEHANIEYAAILVDMMKIVARMIVSEAEGIRRSRNKMGKQIN